MKTAAPKKQPAKAPAVTAKLGNPKPVRFSDSDEDLLTRLQTQTRLTKAELIRISVQYAAPKFLNGSVKISDLAAA
jgi:hypothetical protein